MLCRKCGGKLQGEICERHGSQGSRALTYRALPVPSPGPVAHDPWAADTHRRIMAMVGRCCKGCTWSCGDMERCPLQRAKWFGDWSGEQGRSDQPALEVPPAVIPPVAKRRIETQLSLF